MDGYMLPWVKSCFSFRYGSARPGVLAEAAARNGFRGAVLADRCGVYGQFEFASACRGTGVAGVPGADLTVHGRRYVFVALSGGWDELSLMVTSSHLPGRVQPEEAFGNSGNLVCISLSSSDTCYLRETLGFQGRILNAVLPFRECGTDPASSEASLVAMGLEPLAVWPSMFCGPEDRTVHRILRQADSLLGDPRVTDLAPPFENSDLPDAGSFGKAFRGAERSLANNRELASLTCSLPVQSPPRPPGGPDDDRELRELTSSRLGEHYGRSPAARRRLEKELETISRAGLSGYFLTFGDIIEHCRRGGVTVTARGSAAGSIVSFLLGISIVCPLRYDLSFSRFFNRLRAEPPDIDLDLDSERRDEVMEWFLRRQGRRAASVSQVVTYRSKSAFRTAAAASGMGPEEIDSLAKILSDAADPVWKKPRMTRILDDSRLLRGLPSHMAPHPCGVVCANSPVDGIVPVEGASGGLEITHLDKDGVEFLGLLKMDLLGQRGLTALTIACRGTDHPPSLLFRRQGALSRKALDILNSGRTLGVAHIESPALRGLLREMDIRSIEDVSRALALVRPGAAAGGGRERYLSRVHRQSRVEYPLPELRELLRENLGVMLYQEDISEAASILLGVDEAQGDLIRRRLRKKSMSRDEILSVCRRRGMSPEKAAVCWDVLSGYAGYGFCKAHSFTYGVVACVSTEMKVERPAAAMAAMLAAGGGFYHSSVYLEEARRMGIRLLPPGINTGGWVSLPPDDSSIMLGFRHLKGLGREEFERLHHGRPYSSPAQVLAAGCGQATARTMAQAGCFREIGFNPARALWCLEAGVSDLFPEGTGSPDLPDYGTEYRLASELALLDVPLVANPISLVDRPGATWPLRDIPDHGRVKLWGRCVTGRRLDRGAGFMMLEDDTGVADVFLPSPWFGNSRRILRRPGATLLVTGTVESNGRIRAGRIESGPLTVAPAEL
jgi:DNA polymerase III alpha subunit